MWGSLLDKNNSLQFNKKRVTQRSIDEFIGICKGIMFDGTVVFEEAYHLLLWLENNIDVTSVFPAQGLYQILPKMIESGVLKPDDQAILMDYIVSMIGSYDVMIEGHNASTELPLCKPPPTPKKVRFLGSEFVITGNLKAMSRDDMTKYIKLFGGSVSPKTVTLNTDYLIIGDIGSKAWRHSTHGRKIERAVELRDKQKTGIKIFSETHFIHCLSSLVDVLPAMNINEIESYLKTLWIPKIPKGCKDQDDIDQEKEQRHERVVRLIVGHISWDKQSSKGIFRDVDWAYDVGYCFREALDLSFDKRFKDKKPFYTWTQGFRIYFKEGDLLTSKKGFPTLQVQQGIPMSWDQESKSVDQGQVSYQLFKNIRYGDIAGIETINQMEFLNILLFGLTE